MRARRIGYAGCNEPKGATDAAEGVEREAGTAVRAHQEGSEAAGSQRGRRAGDRGADGQQGTGRAGEAREASRTSIRDISSSRRGGLRSHSGPGGRTRDQLYEEAREKGIRGRSKMTKAELRRAVGR
jgi:hypothetical protein